MFNNTFYNHYNLLCGFKQMVPPNVGKLKGEKNVSCYSEGDRPSRNNYLQVRLNNLAEYNNIFMAHGIIEI